jgi:hypothetical protein
MLKRIVKDVTVSITFQANTKRGYYHIKNLETEAIFSFDSVEDLCAYIVAVEIQFKNNSIACNNANYRNLVRVLKENNEDILLQTTMMTSHRHVYWKGSYKTGLKTTRDKVAGRRKSKQSVIFIVDLLQRTIVKYKDLVIATAAMDVSVSSLCISLRRKKPFLKGRYFCVATEIEGQRLLSQYKAPLPRNYRRIISIKVYEITSNIVKEFASVKEAADYYGIEKNTLQVTISSISSDFKGVVKIPNYDNLTFEVEFDH